MLCMAAIVVYDEKVHYSVRALIGALSVLRISHFKRGLWPWLPFNAGITSLACVAAAVMYGAMPASLSIAAVVPAAVTFVAVSWTLLVVSYAVEEGRVPRALVLELGPSLLHALPFAVLGFLVGRLYLNLGSA